MADEITVQDNSNTESLVAQSPATQTQPAQPVEENPNGGVVTENKGENGAPSGEVTTNVTENVTETQNTPPADNAGVPQPTETVEDLRRQLDEYKARDEELRELSTRLGTDKVANPQFIEAQKQLDIIDNQAQQAYISLCNQYGVDYRPENIERSANELKAKDPQAYYDLQYKLGQLDNAVNAKRAEVNNFIVQKQISSAINRHSQMLNASPALQQQLARYISETEIVDPDRQIDGFMSMALPIARESFEYGKIVAKQEMMKQQQNPSEVLNNNVATQHTPYSSEPPKTFTREQIANMSQAEFEKYEKDIDLAWKEGRIK